MALTVCFIDDSPFERDLFARVYGSTPGWDPVVAETFAQAREMLGNRIPLLWLLDLWGNDPLGSAEPELISPQELARKAAQIRNLESVWEGLDGFQGDVPNEFLKRFYSVLSGWSTLFLETAALADQTRAYGLYNLSQVRRHYPDTVALAYTRKSQSVDLASFLAAGGDGALLKPHGPDDKAILEQTRKTAPDLVDQMHRILKNRLEASLLRQSLVLSGSEGAYLFSLAGALMGRSSWPPERTLEVGPYLAGWVAAARTWIMETGDF